MFASGKVRSGCLPCCLQIFLEQGQYQAVESSRQEAAAVGKGKVSKDRIHRTIGRQRPIRYEITDKAPTDKATWDRVVALFCLGKAWQFKAYPKALFPVSFLSRHCNGSMLCLAQQHGDMMARYVEECMLAVQLHGSKLVLHTCPESVLA